MTYICKQYMPLICLWPGMMLDKSKRYERDEPQKESEMDDQVKRDKNAINQVSIDNNANVEK